MLLCVGNFAGRSTDRRLGEFVGKPPASFMKRQREQAKREKKALKAEKKALRKNDNETDGSGPQIDENVIMETPEDTSVPV